MFQIQPDLVIPNTREEINGLPTTSGIYIYYDGSTILYIGKSINLKARLLSHLENAKLDQKEAAIVNQCDHIECIITDSEFKALLLESRLIQDYKPKYNARLKDDKSYLYIKITKEEYPKITAVRRENDGVSRYFGPFPSMRSVEELIRELRRVFPFCTQKKLGKRPCFYSKIDLCKPCPNEIETITDEEQKKRLKKHYKASIRSVIRVLNGDSDLVLKDMYRQLTLLSEAQLYEESIILRNRLHRLEHLIYDQLFVSETAPGYNQAAESVEKLVLLLDEFFPELKTISRIECYDISNTQQKHGTASMVVFTDGLMDKKEYRRFKIKDLALQSDFDMLDEAFHRRLKNKWPMPDLFVVDGGRPQVARVRQVFSDLGIAVPLIGIAKHPDRLVIGIEHLPTIRPAIHNLGFNMIRAIRDESHRFAKKYHVLLRDKKMMEYTKQ